MSSETFSGAETTPLAHPFPVASNPAAAPSAARGARPTAPRPTGSATADPTGSSGSSGSSLADQGISPALLAQQAAAGQPAAAAPARYATDSDRDLSRLPQWAQHEFEKTQHEVRKLRDEAAGWRVRYREADDGAGALRHAIAEASGLATDDVTAERLGELFAYAASEAQRALVTQETLVAAVEHGADPAMLLRWMPFLDAAEELDPSDDGFKAALGELVHSTLESTPMLRAPGQAPARTMPARSGAEIPGGSGGQQPITDADLASMSPDQIAAALDRGLLRHLM